MFQPISSGELRHSGRWSHFSIGKDLMPRELITAYATLKKAAAIANHAGNRLDDLRHKFIVHYAGLRRDSGRSASGHVSAARVDDGQRDAAQHECERSDL